MKLNSTSARPWLRAWLMSIFIGSLILFPNFRGNAQTTLQPGDIAIYEMNITSNRVGFVLLKDVTANTVIYITDLGWDNVAGNFAQTSLNFSNECIFQWTTDAPIQAGTTFYLSCSASGPFSMKLFNNSANTDISNQVALIKVPATGDPFLITGENLFIYQDPILDRGYPMGNPRFLAGMNNNNNSSANNNGWSEPLVSGHAVSSSLPNSNGTKAGLTNGLNAVGFTGGSTSMPNVFYTGPTSPVDAAGWAARLNNASNFSRTGPTSIGSVIQVTIPPSITYTGHFSPLSTNSGSPSSITFVDLQLNGINGSVDVYAPNGFEVSLYPTGPFHPGLNFPVMGGSQNQSLFLRLSASAPAGTYSGPVMILTPGNLTYIQTSPSTVFGSIQASVISSTQVACNGGSNGSATVRVSGGAAPYTYSWSPSGGTSASAIGLTAGTYTVTVTDANGSSTTASVTITQPPAIVAGTSQSNVSCGGGANGTASVSVSGGVGPYTYNWTPGNPAGDGSKTVTGLTAGQWSVMVTDANSCSVNKNFTISQPIPMQVTTSKTDVSCNGGTNGSATAMVMGGTMPNTYSWSPSGGTGPFTTGRPAGKYTITATDANGCTASSTVIISQPPALSLSSSYTNVLCFGASTGSATVSPAGGVSPYSYSWTPNVSQGPTASNLSAGNYSVVVSDANGCTANQNFVLTQGAQLTLQKSQTNVACNGGTNGAASVTVSGGTPNYTYQWLPSGATGSSVQGLAAGSYSVKVTDRNHCVSHENIVITQPPAISVNGVVTHVACNGGSNGAVSITASGGGGNYTYSWQPAVSNSAIATGLSAGSYTCTVTDANGCSVNKTFLIQEPAALNASVALHTDVSCNGGNDGSITIFTSGGTAPFAYQWSPSGGNSKTASNLSAGSYTCTVTDMNGCQKQVTDVITQPSLLTASLNSVTAVSCNGGNNGSATVSVSGGVNPYSYSWTSGGGSAPTGTNLPAGTHVCTVTDANHCTVTQPAVITEPSAVSVSVASKTDVTCSGQSNGAATVTASGGTGPYLYMWSPAGGNSATATNLAQGIYTVYVKDAKHCSGSTTVTIGAQNGITAQLVSQTNPVCSGASTGSATVSASGGTPFQSQGTVSFTNNTAFVISDLATLYSPVTVSNIAGTVGSQLEEVQVNISHTFIGDLTLALVCPDGTELILVNRYGDGADDYPNTVFAGNGTSISQASPPYSGTYVPAEPFSNLSNCTANGTWKLKVSDNATNDQGTLMNWKISFKAGNGPTYYQYSWSPSGGTAATATGLSAGNYTCTITDANNCTVTQDVIITAPHAIKSTLVGRIPVSCNGGSNGAAIINATGGTGNLQYSWSPSGGTSHIANGLAAGTYTCTITDANGCFVTQQATIQEPAALVVNENHNNVSCFSGSDGAADLTVSGGFSPYTYNWTPGQQTTEDLTGLKAGSYSVTVTDQNGCTATKNIIITETTPITATISATGTTCNGGTDGSAAVVASGGTGQLSYSWSPSGGTSATATGLAAGQYTCTITDENHCVKILQIKVDDAAGIKLTLQKQDAKCFGDASGSVSVNATGGAGNFSYLWSPSGGSQAQASQLTAGDYSLRVTDGAGCVKDTTVKILQPRALSIAATGVTHVSCNGGSNGVIAVNASGGTSPMSYSWSPSAGSGSTATGLSAGLYTVTVTDGNHCTRTKSITVTEPEVLTASASSTAGVSCHGGKDGTATLTVSGGTPSYYYMWPDGQSQATATGLAAGTYSVKISDENNCVTSHSITIAEPSALSASVSSQKDISCNGADDGKATITAAGGTAPYSFKWTAGEGNQATALLLTPGNHSCVVTDNKGCTATVTATVSEPQKLAGTVLFTNDVLCHGGATGKAGIAATGGTAPYTYNWSPVISNSSVTGNLPAGSYSCTIKDKNFCTTTVTGITINEPASELTATATPKNATCFGIPNGAATVNATGGTPGYTYSWSPSGGNNATAFNLPNGIYTCTVRDLNGCTATKSVTIASPSQLMLTLSHTDVNCFKGTDGTAKVMHTGGTAPYQYIWAHGPATPSVSNLQAGTYNCVVVDANHCKQSIQTVIKEPAGPLSIAVESSDVTCAGGNNGSIKVTPAGGTPGYNYDWQTFSGFIPERVNLTAGKYTITIIDSKLCRATQDIIISEPLPISATNSVKEPHCAGYQDGTATVFPTGGTGSYSYNWSPTPGGGQQTSTADKIGAGTWTCTITDANGCSYTESMTLSQPLPVAASLADFQPVCLDAGPVQLSGGLPAGGHYSGPGVSSNVFDPATAGTGVHTISYTYTDATGCSGTASKTITVNALPQISTNVPASVCAEAAPVKLYAVPETGQWSGAGVSSGLFTPSLSLIGQNQLTFSSKDPVTGCSNKVAVDIEVKALPKPDIIVPSVLFCSNESTTLDVSPFDSYSWYLNGTVIASAASRSLTVSNPGTYKVTVGLNGCYASDEVLMQTRALPKPQITFKANTSFCDTGTVELSTGEFNNYQWFRNNEPVPAAFARDFSAFTAGTYAVRVYNGECFGSSAPVVINGASPIGLAIITDHGPGICPGESVKLEASPAKYYQWTFNGGDISGATSSVYYVTAPGSYAVRGTDESGCTVTTDGISFEPATNPVGVVTYNGDLDFCEGNSVLLLASAAEGFQWKRDGEVISGAIYNTLNVHLTGTYTVEVRDMNNCAGLSNAVEVEVFALPSVELNHTGVNVTCDNDEFTLAVPSGATSYQWIFNNQPLPGASLSTLPVTTSGAYRVTAVSAHGCTSQSEVSVVIVNSAPAIPEILVDHDTLSTHPAIAYQWYRDGEAIPGAVNRTFTMELNGTYQLEVFADNGCSSYSEPFTVNNVAVEDHGNQLNVEVFPNTFTENFTIRSNQPGTYQLIDMSGKIVISGKLGEGNTIVNGGAISQGLYCLQVQAGNNTATVKMVK